jgi:hypothetical protein
VYIYFKTRQFFIWQAYCFGQNARSVLQGADGTGDRLGGCFKKTNLWK